MKAELMDRGNSIVIDNFIVSKSDVRNGNPYNTTFNIFVTSGSFCGVGECEYDIKEFKRFACELRETYDFKRKCAVLNDICYGSEIIFTMNKLGGVNIQGEIYADGMQHRLDFRFDTDQSALRTFINGLNQMIEYAYV